MNTVEHLLLRIDDCCSRYDMSEGAFGREVMNDSSFVADLKRGRSPTMRTLERLEKYLQRRGV